MDAARKIGVRGVPFFVINRRYAISGAQDASVFADTFNKALENKE
jgi:predicted DsbA family dithiol-disulfide isomerase